MQRILPLTGVFLLGALVVGLVTYGPMGHRNAAASPTPTLTVLPVATRTARPSASPFLARQIKAKVYRKLDKTKLKDHNKTEGLWFVFQDLSVRTEGSFRLKFSFVDIGDENVSWAFAYCGSS